MMNNKENESRKVFVSNKAVVFFLLSTIVFCLSYKYPFASIEETNFMRNEVNRRLFYFALIGLSLVAQYLLPV